MRKEVVLAILLGFGIGLVIALGVLTARTALKRQPYSGEAAPAPSAENQDSSLSAVGGHSLTISSPGDNEVVSREEAAITGTTTPGSTLVITAEEEDFILEADDLGQFSQIVPLIGGVNSIRGVSFSPEGERAEAELTLVFTTAEF